MARYWFGGGIADWAFSAVTVSSTPNLAQVTGGSVITFWSAETGGSQYTDLLDSDGAPVMSIMSSDGTGVRAVGQVPPFQGPDNVVEMWASANGGPRSRMLAMETPAGAQAKADAAQALSAQRAANLSDLADAAIARTNLGLGGAAVLNVGTTAGTVAAGDDARITSPGYDIIVLAGQSNMSGRGTPYGAVTDPTNPRILQWRTHSPTGIQPAAEPLDMHDTPSGIGPGLQFARWYAANRLASGRSVLIVPTAHGGTPLVSNAALAWRYGVSGNLAANMRTQALAAKAAADAVAGTVNTFVAWLWCQGETDGDALIAADQYATDFDALAAGVRADLGVADLPIVILGMVPEYLGTGNRALIDTVHRDSPRRNARCDFAAGATSANLGDGNHYNGAGQRTNGQSMWAAYLRILGGLAPNYTDGSAAISNVMLAAYSLARLAVGTYSGPLLRVRRSSDNAEQDISASGGAVNLSALTTFVGSGSGYLVTLYDQSGQGMHLTQATTAAQPQIVNAGTPVTSGGKLAATFDGVDDVVYRTSAIGLYRPGGAAMSCQVLSAATPAGSSRIWAESTSTQSSSQYALLQPDSATAFACPVVSTGTTSGGITGGSVKGTVPVFNGSIHQATGVDTGAAMLQWVDGAVDLTSTAYSQPSPAWPAKDRFAIGGVVRSGSLAPLAMTFSELLLWGYVPAPSTRQSVEAAQKAFFGTP